MLEVHSAKGDRRAHASISAEIASSEEGLAVALKRAMSGREREGHERLLTWKLNLNVG